MEVQIETQIETPEKTDHMIAVEILESILSRSALGHSEIERAAAQILKKPLVSSSDRLRDVKGRITIWLRNGGYSEFRSRRVNRGKLVFTDNDLLFGDEDNVGTDDRLSRLNLKRQGSIERDRNRSHDLVEHATKNVSPRNSEALLSALPVVEDGDSLGEIARKTGRYPAQIQRAFEGAREMLANPARRAKRPLSKTASLSAQYDPRRVPMELCLQVHQGPVLWDFSPLKLTHTTRRSNRPMDLSELPRPRKPVRIQHPTFGWGVILRKRTVDSGECLDMEFDSGRRATVMTNWISVTT
jgi:LysM repeat protein